MTYEEAARILSTETTAEALCGMTREEVIEVFAMTAEALREKASRVPDPATGLMP